MKGKNVLCALLATALLALVSAIPASADQPDIQKFEFDMTWQWEDNPCGFVIEEHLMGALNDQTFYDKNGNRVRYQAPGSYVYTWSHEGNTVEVLVSGSYREDIISATEIEVHILGTNQLITVPGYGRVHGMVGNLGFRRELIDGEWVITEVFKVDGATWLEEWGPICEYLGS